MCLPKNEIKLPEYSSYGLQHKYYKSHHFAPFVYMNVCISMKYTGIDNDR